MRLANATRTHEKKTAISRRVFARQTECIIEGAELRAVVCRRLIIAERASLVTARDACRFEELLLSVLRTAAAAARALTWHDFHSGAEAERADNRLPRG